VRARRRHKELVKTGHDVTLQDVARDLQQRDARDSARADAPLRPAADAVVLDTSEMGIDEAVARAIGIVRRARG